MPTYSPSWGNVSVFMKGTGMTARADGVFIPGTGGRLFSIYIARVSSAASGTW